MNGIEQYLYLVVNRENNFIYSMCDNCSIANALSKGFINSSVMAIPYTLFKRPATVINYVKNEHITYKLVNQFMYGGNNLESNLGETIKKTNTGKLFDIVLIDTNLPNDWIKIRKICNTRTIILTNLENKLKRYFARYKESFYDESFYNFLTKELEECFPTENIFSPLILEYAKIIKLEPNETFQHLKMKHDCFKLCIFRHTALWEKYVDLVIKTDEEKNELYQNFEFELMGMNRN
jgi:hypothetical protein